MPVGNDCVHEDIIIGASVGVGVGVLVILLVLLVIVWCKLCERPQKDKAYRRSYTLQASSPTHVYVDPSSHGPVYTGAGETDSNYGRLPPEVERSESYVNFTPQWRNVDTNREYVLKRAQLSEAPSHPVLLVSFSKENDELSRF